MDNSPASADPKPTKRRTAPISQNYRDKIAYKSPKNNYGGIDNIIASGKVIERRKRQKGKKETKNKIAKLSIRHVLQQTLAKARIH